MTKPNPTPTPSKKNPTPRFTAAQYQKLLRLLDMEYKPGEIAEEIGISRETITRSFVKFGMPARKDTNGHYWINGKEFTAWVKQTRDTRKRPREMGENDFYCAGCGIVTPETYARRKHGTIDVLHASCPMCNRKVAKFAKHEAQNDQ